MKPKASAVWMPKILFIKAIAAFVCVQRTKEDNGKFGPPAVLRLPKFIQRNLRAVE